MKFTYKVLNKLNNMELNNFTVRTFSNRFRSSEGIFNKVNNICRLLVKHGALTVVYDKRYDYHIKYQLTVIAPLVMNNLVTDTDALLQFNSELLG